MRYAAPVKKKEAPATGYRIRVGYVTSYVVEDRSDHSIVAAFDSLRAAMSHFPTAEVSESAWRKAKELGQK